MTADVRPRVRRTVGKARGRIQVLHYTLWLVQGLLALVFLFAGSLKLITPIGTILAQMPVPLPGPFVQFISVAEIFGATGLILPGLLHVREWLTPLAAAGLVVIMTGATVLTLVGGGGALALSPLVLGLLAAFVAYGRWRLRPLSG